MEIPVPAPEPNSGLDRHPARCECGEIIDAHPASREDGRWEGWCQFHGTVVAVYSFQNSEIDEEEES